jgi:hypothetical protein
MIPQSKVLTGDNRTFKRKHLMKDFSCSFSQRFRGQRPNWRSKDKMNTSDFAAFGEKA